MINQLRTSEEHSPYDSLPRDPKPTSGASVANCIAGTHLSWREAKGMTVTERKIRQMRNKLGCGEQDVSTHVHETTHWARQSQR